MIQALFYTERNIAMSNKASQKTLSLLLLLLPTAAIAHTGGSVTTGLLHGFTHPFSGLDHLLAMLAVGLWASQSGGRALWMIPCTFVVVMMFGGMLGLSGLQVPFVETGILLSILVLGALIAGAFKFPVNISVILVAAFALFHGHAHGTEMPSMNLAISYIIGFSLATITLHSIGLVLGILLQKVNFEKISRLIGAAIVFSGLFLAL